MITEQALYDTIHLFKKHHFKDGNNGVVSVVYTDICCFKQIINITNFKSYFEDSICYAGVIIKCSKFITKNKNTFLFYNDEYYFAGKTIILEILTNNERIIKDIIE